MITCPKCGSKISDHSEKCVHCSYDLFSPSNSTYNQICPECKNEIDKSNTICPHCGFPLENRIDVVSHISTSPAKTATKKKLFLTILASLLVLLCIAVFIYMKNKTTQPMSPEEYIAFSNETMDKIFEGGTLSIKVATNVSTIYLNALLQKQDLSTDKYARPLGEWVEQPQTAIDNFYNDNDTKEKFNLISKNQSEVRTKMQILQNPPSGLEELYATVDLAYESYVIVTDTVLSPVEDWLAYDKKIQDSMKDIADIGSIFYNQIIVLENHLGINN